MHRKKKIQKNNTHDNKKQQVPVLLFFEVSRTFREACIDTDRISPTVQQVKICTNCSKINPCVYNGENKIKNAIKNPKLESHQRFVALGQRLDDFIDDAIRHMSGNGQIYFTAIKKGYKKLNQRNKRKKSTKEVNLNWSETEVTGASTLGTETRRTNPF